MIFRMCNNSGAYFSNSSRTDERFFLIVFFRMSS